MVTLYGAAEDQPTARATGQPGPWLPPIPRPPPTTGRGPCSCARRHRDEGSSCLPDAGTGRTGQPLLRAACAPSLALLRLAEQPAGCRPAAWPTSLPQSMKRRRTSARRPACSCRDLLMRRLILGPFGLLSIRRCDLLATRRRGQFVI